MAVRAGIIGGAGYTGGELIRLLINHPDVILTFINSRSNAGKKITAVHQDLAGETELSFTADISDDIDVLFLCVGHGEANKFLSENNIDQKIKIIDLSQDHRLNNFKDREFVYGLPEVNRQLISTAGNIANPGCFATAIQLGLLPLAEEGILNEVFTTGITGSTGAGQSLSTTSHFSWRTNNIQAYKSLSHQHVGEITNTLKKKSPNVSLSFIPWRGDFARGIFISSQIKTDLPIDRLLDLYKSFYKDDPFTFVTDEPIALKQVVNTNKCLIQLEKADATLVVHSVIDNLLKGASGQALENMNIMFGLDEKAGLKLKANYF